MSELEIYDFQAQLSEDGELIVTLNDVALDHLIEMLNYLREEEKWSGKHFHIDEVSGLEGNVRSIIFMRR